MMGLGNDPGRIYRAFQIAGDDGIEGFVMEFIAHLLSLKNTILSEFSLRLSLHNLTDIIHCFAVPD
jgi:hypothetical protein